MKRILLLLPFFCYLSFSGAFASRIDEIDMSFRDMKNTGKCISKVKSPDKKKTVSTKKTINKNKFGNTTENPPQNAAGTIESEGVITRTQEKQEEEKRRYRELEELSELTAQGIALYTDNNYDESLNCFFKIPEKMRSPDIWLLIGNILMDKGKKEDAAFMYGRAVLADGTYYKAYYNLGNIYLEDDRFNLAIEEYKSALKYCQSNPYVYYNLGCAYVKSGDLKKARFAFTKAIELKNTVADFHYNLAFVCKKLGKEKQTKIYLDNYNKLTGHGTEK